MKKQRTQNQCQRAITSFFHIDLLYLQPLRKHAHVIYGKCFDGENEKIHWKNFDIFLIFAQNIDCGYTLEPPRREPPYEYPRVPTM